MEPPPKVLTMDWEIEPSKPGRLQNEESYL